jgi:GAF domain-containing protein
MQAPPEKGTSPPGIALVTDPAERLAAVRRYEILDPPRDGTFDRVAALAAAIFAVPIATVTIVDVDRVWLAGAEGLEGVTQVGTEPGLCASAVLADGPYIVNDAAADPRTLDHPLVRGELGLRFYAAAPITVADGHRLGTVNVIDREPRDIVPQVQLEMLASLAAIVAGHLDLRLSALSTVRTERDLRDRAERHAADSTRRVADALASAAPAVSAAAPPTCQLGGVTECLRKPELKVADSWGDSAWGCVHHVEEVLLSGSSVFVADESMSGLAQFLRRGRRD